MIYTNYVLGGFSKMKKLSKEFLGLAGEYAVASELCKRNLFGMLTMGNHKKTDIIVENDRMVSKISVKTKQGREWPSVYGINKNDDYLVFVDYQNKDEMERPDFFILDLNEWNDFVKKESKKIRGSKIDEKYGLIGPDGWKGVNIKVDHLMDYKENWETITTKFNE